MYWRLSEWLKEPVTKRMYDLIQKETDIDRKTEMTNHFVESTTVKKQKPYQNNYAAQTVTPLESTENDNIDTESQDIFQPAQEESSEPQEEFSDKSSIDGQALLAELQSKTVPGPPRTRTTQDERDAIRYWSTIHPNSSPEERKQLALSLGLSKMSVGRLIAYDRKMSQKKSMKDEAEAKIISKYRSSDLEVGRARLENVREEPYVNTEENLNLLDEKPKSDLFQQADTSSIKENYKILGSDISNFGNNQVQSRFITINSEKVKAVIRNAMKSNPAGFDPKKSYKVVLKPTEGPSKYNKLALDSYFKNKQNPTEAQIEHFVECTKVPYNVTKKYLLERGSFRMDHSSYVEAKNKEFQAKLDKVSERSSSANDATQQNDGYFQQEYPPPFQQFQTEEPGPPSQHFQPLTSHQNQFPNLHKDQVAWLENFYHTTPNPDMQTIMDFSKCIDVPFTTVAEFMEKMQTNTQNNSYSNYQETETNIGSKYKQEFSNVDPDVLDLVRKISKKTYSPILERELKSLFGNNKIFCTLDDIKSYATANGMSYQVIYKKLNMQENIQLVSEQTCKRLVGAASNTDSDDYERDDVKMGGESNYTSIKSEPVDYFENQVDNFRNENQGHETSNSYYPNINFGAKVGNKNVDSPETTAMATKERVESTYDGLSVTMVAKDIPNIKQEPETDDTGIPVNNWLTSTELLFEENDLRNRNVVCKPEPQFFNHASGDVGIEMIEIDIETSMDVRNGKRKSYYSEESPPKKSKNAFNDDLPYDDSGYSTNEDSMLEGSSFSTSDSLSNMIYENLGKVNMLNESLDLFNDSVKDMDLVNDMYQKIENEDASMNAHVKVKIETSELSEEESMMKALTFHEPSKQSLESSEPEDPNKFNDLRKLFYGPFDNFQPLLQVVSIKPGFKSDVFEVELSDGTEFSNNFYFKTGASALKNNLMIKLKQLRYIGARICVESFEIIRQESSILGNPDPIEDQFFTDLRSSKIEPSDLFEISSPKTIVEYILLEENVRTFIESFGCNIDLFKFATGEEDVKKEILFSMCKSGKKFQSKLLKILSSFLSMSRQDIEQYVQSCKTKLGGSSVYLDHGYCNLAAVFL